ncbi:MAG: serine hydrolase domain-containing protein [Angelakisella sp.]
MKEHTIDGIIDRDFGGCVLISQDGEILVEKAFGFADLPNQIPNTPTTKFGTASAGKVFVAVAVLQLIEKGLLQFSDSIVKLLDYDLHNIDPNATVEQLLTHTSGIPDYFDESVMEDYEELWADYPNYKIRTNADLLPLFIHKPMMYPCGERFQYNNSGYVVLALIIEKVTGMPFDRYLAANIFAPCGMVNTGYYALDRLPANCATGYIFDEGKGSYRTNIYSIDVKGTGAGGAYTTVGDINRFWEKLLSGKLLSSAMTANMLACHSGSIEDGYYGYGVWLKKRPNNTHSPYFQGSDPGVSFITVYEPSKNMTVTLVSNYGDNVWRLLRNIREQYI